MDAPMDGNGGPGPAMSTRSVAAALQPALWLWLACTLLFGAFDQFWALAGPPDGEGVWLLTFELMSLLQLALVVAVVGRDPEARRVLAPILPQVAGLCLLLAAVAWLVLAKWHGLLPDYESSPDLIVLQRDARWPLWLCLSCNAVMPAVSEELLYRGLLLQRLRRVCSIELAIAVQAMLFALAHLDGTWLLPHFAFGAVLGVLRFAAGGLWPCLLMHGLWNGSLVVAAYA